MLFLSSSIRLECGYITHKGSCRRSVPNNCGQFMEEIKGNVPDKQEEPPVQIEEEEVTLQFVILLRSA